MKFVLGHAPKDGSRTATILSEKAEQVEEDLKLNKERGLYDASKLLSMKTDFEDAGTVSSAACQRQSSGSG